MENPKSKRIKITTNINRRLPQHIIQVIFSKLPIVYLPSCRIVCKSWNDHILNHASTYTTIPNTFVLCASRFHKPKMQCMEFDPKRLEGMRFVSSARILGDLSSIISNYCNGLLLLVMQFRHRLSCVGILNPMTNEYIDLVVEENKHHPRRLIYFYGFGFSPRTKRYKVARVFFNIKKMGTIFEIFTFGGRTRNQWRRIVDYVPFEIRNNCVYLDGALYWIGERRKGNFMLEYVVCRLDVEDEKIETTSILEAHHLSDVYIGTFNGCVYASFFLMCPRCKIEVWMMQRHGGKSLWTREIVIGNMPGNWVLTDSWSVYFKLIKVYEDGEILCLVNHHNFILYDPKMGTIKSLNESQFPRFLSVYQIESINFGSLQKILAGDDG